MDSGIITHQPAIDWEDLDDLYFNDSRLEEKLSTELCRTKFMDKLLKTQ